MATKLSKSILKEIVKECILEIFEESFFSSSNMIHESKFSDQRNYKSHSQNNKVSKRPRAREKQYEGRRSALDNISYAQQESNTRQTTPQFDQKINNITAGMTNDPVMANIFKDTAATTLQEQIGAESNKGMSVLAGGDTAAKRAYNSDPTELFSEASSKWASLAFADPIRK